MISNIEVLNEITGKRFLIESKKIVTTTHEILCYMGLDTLEVCVKLVETDEIRKLNELYRQKDKPTDVLSFPQLDWSEPYLPGQKGAFLHQPHSQTLGDIVICPEVALKNANSIGQTLDRELCFLIVHGILHLCGHDHINKEEEKIMFTLQDKIVSHLVKHHKHQWNGCLQYIGNS